MKKLIALALTALLCGATAQAQIWDEFGNGGGDAGDFPLGGYQTQSTSTLFTTITGNIAGNLDLDAFEITVTNAASFLATTVPLGTETDTRLWLFDKMGNLVMANDDRGASFGGGLGSELRNPASWTAGGGTLTNNPGSLIDGECYILVIGGFSNNFADAGGNAIATFSPFTSLHGVNPLFTGPATQIIGTNGTGGTYTINLTGAYFGCVAVIPEPATASLLGLLGCVGLMVRRRR
ncbi:MAG TPA: PEP-CTERM sorting domain-containing protein [Pirellulaceae bacterium]|nr:PEP-CTERM sorting domain-containing protein [Pirellulaceae bacterium]